jgi:hypothetical protein
VWKSESTRPSMSAMLIIAHMILAQLYMCGF